MKSGAKTLPLFHDETLVEKEAKNRGETVERLGRLDTLKELRARILPLCRLKYGDIWEDRQNGHRVGVLDATKPEDVKKITGNEKGKLAISDPPYNVEVGNVNTANLFKIGLGSYLGFSRKWVQNVIAATGDDAHFYVWIGADYKDNFQPLPDFIILRLA